MEQDIEMKHNYEHGSAVFSSLEFQGSFGLKKNRQSFIVHIKKFITM